MASSEGCTLSLMCVRESRENEGLVTHTTSCPTPSQRAQTRPHNLGGDDCITWFHTYRLYTVTQARRDVRKTQCKMPLWQQWVCDSSQVMSWWEQMQTENERLQQSNSYHFSILLLILCAPWAWAVIIKAHMWSSYSAVKYGNTADLVFHVFFRFFKVHYRIKGQRPF